MDTLKKLIPQSIKNLYHLAQAVLANFLYGFPARSSYANSVAGGPSRSIKIIGVTGTNGKTTTTQMIGKILEEAGFKVALASTINFKIGEKEWVNKTKFTTLSSFQIQKFILDAVKARCEYLVLETSSHALDQNRVWGVKYQTAVITNVTREHFDYHKNFENYRAAKMKLFRKAKTAIVNLGMDKPDEFLGFDNENKIGYNLQIQNPKSQFQIKSKIQNINAENVELGINYSKFNIQNSKFILNLLGEFNIENALAAVGVGISENISLETMARALEKIKVIPGRLEYVENNKNLNIIVDYAVTPDSLEKLYDLIQTIRKNSFGISSNSRVIAVFGACGERDRGKRPMMGEIVSRLADYIVITNEDPYNEDPKRIIDEVFEGVINSKSETLNSKQIQNPKSKIQNLIRVEGENCWRILDRREAIKKALQIAEPGDFVVVTGKGAEETMAVGKERLDWNDKKVILEELAK
jgi:UDP-N-acetylmuramoyl-L-alanyl-D-glutamate--2,6-diaminopimelate ligase